MLRLLTLKASQNGIELLAIRQAYDRRLRARRLAAVRLDLDHRPRRDRQDPAGPRPGRMAELEHPNAGERACIGLGLEIGRVRIE